MSKLLPLALLLATSTPAAPPPLGTDVELSPTVERTLRSGVRRSHGFEGWRAPLLDEAMQEAWCLVLENHPDVLSLAETDVASTTVQVARRDGRTVQMPLQRRLYELGVKARNVVLRDNHLSRQTGGEQVAFAPLDDGVGYGLRRLGSRTPPRGPEDA